MKRKDEALKKALDMDNPAENFIDKESRPEIIRDIAPAMPTPWETKTQRLQLLIKPSLHRLLKERARAEHDTVNNLANRIFEEALTQ